MAFLITFFTYTLAALRYRGEFWGRATAAGGGKTHNTHFTMTHTTSKVLLKKRCVFI